MWFEFTVPKSPVPLPTLSCSNLHQSPRLPHPWVLHINSNTPTEPFPLFLQQCAPRTSFLHCTGFSSWHCQEELRSSKVSVKFARWLCRNTSEGNTQCSLHAHDFFPLCRMKIHKLEGKTMVTPEIFPILVGLRQLAKVTYSKCHENYTHDNNVQWNIFKLRWNQVCNPSDAAALDNFFFFPFFFGFFSVFFF